MTVPEGIPNPHNLVCRLRKSLYGLKQASREWFDKLQSELLDQGFVKSKNDCCLFIKRHDTHITIMVVYVDDIIITGTDIASITAIKQHLDIAFSIKDLGVLHYFLGIEVDYVPDGTVLTQSKFTKELLHNLPFDVSKKVATPLPAALKLNNETGPLIQDPEIYRSLVGKLNYLTNTRPDLNYSVQVLSQFMHAPRVPHWEALIHTIRYIAHSCHQGILLRASDQLTLQAYSDSDWAACPNTRRSITGYVLLFGSSPVAWKSKKQSTVSKSSSESEYRAMASAAADVTWTVRLLEELGVTNLKPVTLHCDNQSSIAIAKNPVFHERTKHIEIDMHFTRDKVMEGLLQLTYLPTTQQLADVFTKILPASQFDLLLSKLGVVSSPPTLRGDIEYNTSQHQAHVAHAHHSDIISQHKDTLVDLSVLFRNLQMPHHPP
ncbi:uncharacterized mitochondrial protein AtMg00810-like [Daucus carota subsp. sativus]|uniref:uncharacterized mitochondrial protein AtMg00810-like n=1 Tax=Daucus carota subsp. sativus TaxID=79200 RepID=UPI0007EFD71D|nr:PREDICTED: uncharacterized mitochondrial protein AtMg00810-like [Daucus carota subsp. sativus]